MVEGCLGEIIYLAGITIGLLAIIIYHIFSEYSPDWSDPDIWGPAVVGILLWPITIFVAIPIFLAKWGRSARISIQRRRHKRREEERRLEAEE
jgi:hypothetical protein